jgi:hypothetical protein
VHHLELIARVLPGVSCEATLKEAAKVWTSLRHHTPNLKACVFTVVFRSCADLYPDHYYTNNETPFPITLLLDTHIPGECLGVTLTQLLAEFAEKGPGVRRFVRIRHLRCDVWRKTATTLPDWKLMLLGILAEEACLLRRTDLGVLPKRPNPGFEQIISNTEADKK